MATAVIPKSVFRRNDNIQIGYGEVPAIVVDGVTAWVHPNGTVTFRESQARKWATEINNWMSNNVKDLKQLLTAA